MVEPPRILVVDDDESVRLMLRRVLERSVNAVVSEAANGAEAVEAAREVSPDVVVLDLLMPVLDGYGALPMVRRALPNAKIVVWSAMSDDLERRPDLRALGADEVLVKSGESMAQLVRSVLEPPTPAAAW